MEVKHTEPPFYAADPGDYGDYNGRCIVILGDDHRIAVVQGVDDEARANARLFVEAPHMLDLLIRIQRAARVQPDVVAFSDAMDDLMVYIGASIERVTKEPTNV